MNRSSDAKSSSSGKTKRPESASRSLAKPLTALAVLVVAAAAVAMFLVNRTGPESFRARADCFFECGVA